jgi:hypothetical protein
MKTRSGLLAALVLALLLALLLAAAPAGAVIGGQSDYPDNTYANVGMNFEWYDLVGTKCYSIAASCTLVRNEPGEVIVLLAAHQAAWIDEDEFAAHPNLVTFKPLPTEMNADGTLLADVAADPHEYGYYKVTAYAVHPGFDRTPYHAAGQSRLDAIGPWREDVALMWLDQQVTVPGDEDGTLMEPAPIVGLYGLDGLDLTHEPFTAVGYGFTAWLRGNDVSFFRGGGAVAWEGRNWREVSVVTGHGTFADRYLHLSQGQADFDSGSPLLHDGTITAVCSFGSPRQASGCYDYRLDTYSAQDFLAGFGLVPDPDGE